MKKVRRPQMSDFFFVVVLVAPRTSSLLKHETALERTSEEGLSCHLPSSINRGLPCLQLIVFLDLHVSLEIVDWGCRL